MRRSFIRRSGSQCAAHGRALFRRRSWARSASRRGPDGGSRAALDDVRHGVDVELLVQRLHVVFLRRDLGKIAMLVAI
eukprot:1374059-Pyramimonas_sp.AAC.1